MEALGMIETKGLLSAIEGADVMAKCADIKVLERIFVGGGLVSVTICGDVGAVKMAVDAGVASIKRLNEESFISCHVIPRPSDELKKIIEVEKVEKTEEIVEEKVIEDIIEIQEVIDNNNEGKEEIILETVTQEIKEEIVEPVKKAEKIEIKDIIEEKIIEVDKVEKPQKKQEIAGLELKVVNKTELDKLDFSEREKVLKELKFHKLRKLAKEYNYFDMPSNNIAKLDKISLIEKILNYYKNL